MTMPIENLLLWDFDGVIIDSIDECLITSYNAYLQYQGLSNEFIYRLDDIPKDIRGEFYRNRKYVRPAAEYFILHKAVSDGIKIDSYSKFNELLQEHHNAVIDFHNFFYSVRDDFRDNQQQYWFGLHRVYAGIKTKWQELKKHFHFYIVSNKDLISISLILNYFDLPVQQEKIFSTDSTLTKKMVIEHILKDIHDASERLFFIDDNYQHLLDVRDTGIRLFYASWGYGEMPDKIERYIIPLELDTFDYYLIKEVINGTVC